MFERAGLRSCRCARVADRSRQYFVTAPIDLACFQRRLVHFEGAAFDGMAALSSHYQILEHLGEGTYGVVTKARAKKHKNRIVALKKIKIKDPANGIGFTALREIKVLRSCKHENIVDLLDVHCDGNTVVLALEFCVTDLETVIKDLAVPLPASHIKTYMQMLLSGVKELHRHFILHRDLKPNNLLLNSKGVLKIADFGFARNYGSPEREMTIRAVTIHYRCPELLLCLKVYGSAVDMWSVGCIFAEFMLRRPYMAGKTLTEMDQLDAIFKQRGTMNLQDWPEVVDLGDMKDIVVSWDRHEKRPFKTLHPRIAPECLELLEGLLDFDPAKRVSAETALEHDYFLVDPMPADHEDMPLPIPFDLRDKPAAATSKPSTSKDLAGVARNLGF